MNPANLSRRTLLTSAAGLAVAPWFLRGASASAASKEPFTLPKLPWPEDALAPLMSHETIQYHYGKHHAAYVANLNKLVPASEFEGLSLEQIVRKAKLDTPIFNNAAQVWNHTFFWHCLSPKGGGRPEGKLAKAIDENFGSFAKFQEQFTDTAVKLFGSGWAWLVQGQDGRLTIEGMPNAHTPIKDGRTPLLTCDVWEHAYYIDYRNARPKFVEAFWKLVNWRTPADRLA
ncbi:MAG: superoxide dismutase [Thermoguttaceae bacterium]|jgi:Fe-Mn family superoxide dismutase|nr:superoxide dismutase [Thermoguttaceae bacterium]